MPGMAYDPRMNYDPARKLTDGDVQDLKPDAWYGDDGKLFREFEFGTYQEGVDFAVRVAAQAEAAAGPGPTIYQSSRGGRSVRPS